MPQELFYKSGTAFKNQLKIFNSYMPCILNAIEDLKFTPDFVQIIFHVHRCKFVEIKHFDRSGSRKKVVATKQE